MRKQKNGPKKTQKTRNDADTVDNPVFFPRFLAKKKKKKRGREALGQKIWVRVGKLGLKCPAPGDRGACEKKKNKQNRTKKNAKNTQKRRYGRKSGRFLRFFDMRVSCSGGE